MKSPILVGFFLVAEFKRCISADFIPRPPAIIRSVVFLQFLVVSYFYVFPIEVRAGLILVDSFIMTRNFIDILWF